MFTLILPFAIALQTSGPGEAWRIVRDAQHATDSATDARFERTWRAVAARDPADRRALLALGTLARLRYQYERADSLFDRIIRQERSATPSAFAAAAHLGKALPRALGTDVVGADSMLSRARIEATAAGEWRVAFQALITLGKLRSRRVGPKVGLELVREARALADHPTGEESAQLSCIEGALMEQAGGDTAGRMMIMEGMRVARRAGALRELGACHLLMAQTAERGGYFGSAAGNARDAVRLFERVHHPLGVASASQWLGYALLVRGYFAEAQVELERAVRTAQRTRFGSVEAWARVDLAELYLALGDGVNARDQAERAATLHKAYGDLWGLAVDLQFQGLVAQSRRDLDEAGALLTASVAAFRRAGLSFNAVSALRMLALTNMSAGRLDSAQRVLDEATRIGRASANAGWAAELPAHLARLALHRGDLRAADSLVVVARANYPWRTGSNELLDVSFAALEAQLALRTRRIETVDSAVAYISSAIARRRQAIDDKDLRAGLAQLRGGWGGLSESYPELVAGLVAAGRVSSAFQFIESVRAREIAEVTLRTIARMNDSSAALTEFRRMSAAVPSLSLNDVRRRMPRDEALAVLTLGAGAIPSTAIVITSDTAVTVSLPPREVVGPLIERYLRIAASGTEPVAIGRQLGAALLQPIARLLPARVTRLAISPDGDLFRVPFDAVRLADDRYAVERFTISLVPSATVSQMVRALPKKPNATRLIALGDPAFARAHRAARPSFESGRRIEKSTRFGGLSLARLPQSAHEARRVAGYSTQSVVWTRDDASESAVRKTNWETVAVAHFATHALIDGEGQARTALALAPSGADDGFLTTSEIASLRFNGALIVLSACQSLGGQILGGEGLRGLTGPLFEAGARAIVVTHWSIGDRSVLPFVDRFYSAMAAGQDVGGALRQTKLAAIRDGARISDWAAFTVIGDASMHAPLRPRKLSPLNWLRDLIQPTRDTGTPPSN